MRKNIRSLNAIKPHSVRRHGVFTTRIRRYWYDVTWIYDHWYV